VDVIDIARILCPVDLSGVSLQAARHAATLARWYEAELHALHVLPTLPTLWGVGPALGALAPELAPAARHERELRDFLERVGTGSLRVEAHVREGDPTQATLDYAARAEVGLIVMGTHGRGGIERVVLGSVAESVLQKTACPVLTVRQGALLEADGPPFKRILCPLDFAPASEQGLAYALSLAREADADLTLLHVMEPYDERWLHEHSPMSAAEYRAFVERQLQARLEQVVAAEARDWCHLEERLATGRAWQEIVRIAAEMQAQVIVMGRHGRKGVDRLLFGSTTHQVVRHAACGVLSVGPKVVRELGRTEPALVDRAGAKR
jgi:nucleotide-binding universal stress UspA family protein